MLRNKNLLNGVALATFCLGVILVVLAQSQVASALSLTLVPMLMVIACPILGLVGMSSAQRSNNNSLFILNVFVFMGVFLLAIFEILIRLW